MKRIAFFLLLATGFASAAVAQDHVEAGVFVDYFRLNQTKSNFAGLGGRLGFKATKHIKLEGEMSYDFNQVFSEGFTDNSTVPPTVTVVRSNLRIIHGLFGPKIELGHSNFHPFLTAKGGFINFRLDSSPANLNTFFSSVGNLRSQDVSAVFYPGAGLEGHLGPVGLRLDVGDEMYFNNGTHHNFRAAFGPYIRF
jgi:hypothetical protein